MNTNFQQGIDLLVELNKQRDGIILVDFSNIYRHFKSGKYSLAIGKKQNSGDDRNTDDDQENNSQAELPMTTPLISPTPR
ncbi:unnamed protein product [Rotaria sp. Silwood1]|nr:unnamed protein product [Rotaria sp. Silwood1]